MVCDGASARFPDLYSLALNKGSMDIENFNVSCGIIVWAPNFCCNIIDNEMVEFYIKHTLIGNLILGLRGRILNACLL